MSGDLRDQLAEVQSLAEEANATAKRVLALLRQGAHDAGDQPDDSAEILGPENGAAAPR